MSAREPWRSAVKRRPPLCRLRRRLILSVPALALGTVAGVPPAALAQPVRSATENPFLARTLQEAYDRLGIIRVATSSDIELNCPDIAENGAIVPVSIFSKAKVNRLALLIEGNPSPLAAIFEVTNEVTSRFSTRVKMAQPANVIAIGFTDDETQLMQSRFVRVIAGGCGG